MGGVIIELYEDKPVKINKVDLPDYKFFCFDGKVKMLYIATERQVRGEKTKFDFFDADFNHIPVQQEGHPNAVMPPRKPLHYNKMVKMAEKLSKGISFVRVDFYDVNDRVYFGEMTFYSMGGYCQYKPTKWDYEFGNWLKLPQIKNED